MNQMETLSNPDISKQASELKALWETKIKPGGKLNVATYEKINAFNAKLKSEYSVEELAKTKLYHILLGSGDEIKPSTQFDLPGGIIEKYIREEL